MDEEFWQERWQQGRICFHRELVNPALERHAPEMPWPDQGRIFVPLCGKSEDMIWLRDHGQKVVGVELATIACRAFFNEHDEAYVLRDSGGFRHYVGDEIEIFCGDFFALTPERLGAVDGAYDRAALVALPPEMRERYAVHMARLVPPGVTLFMQTVEYEQEEMTGPPFSVAGDEVHRLYETLFEVEALEAGDWKKAEVHLAEKGLTQLRECCWRLLRREDG